MPSDYDAIVDDGKLYVERYVKPWTPPKAQKAPKGEFGYDAISPGSPGSPVMYSPNGVHATPNGDKYEVPFAELHGKRHWRILNDDDTAGFNDNRWVVKALQFGSAQVLLGFRMPFVRFRCV